MRPEMAIMIITDHEMSGLRQMCHKSGACDLVKIQAAPGTPDVLAILFSRA
jgi:hypothetical protein